MLATINWKPSRAEMRKFGAVFIAGFAIIGAAVFFRGHRAAGEILWAVGGAIGALAIVAPGAARPFYLAWMGLAFVMGTIVSAAILTIIFYLIVTPIGIIMRLIGRDTLALKKKPGQSTYWVEHPALDDNAYYERLF